MDRTFSWEKIILSQHLMKIYSKNTDESQDECRRVRAECRPLYTSAGESLDVCR